MTVICLLGYFEEWVVAFRLINALSEHGKPHIFCWQSHNFNV
jgi:hypothetical protein